MDYQTPGHASPLAVLRRGVFLALFGALVVGGTVVLLLMAPAWLGTTRFCDPSTRPPASQSLLGQVTGQRFIGSVWIHFATTDTSPASFSYSSDRDGGPVPVLKSALAALQDASHPMQPLPFASLGLFSTRAAEQCLIPDPALRGYVVAEVWVRQVNLGYGGAGSQLRGQAARVVADEIDRLR